MRTQAICPVAGADRVEGREMTTEVELLPLPEEVDVLKAENARLRGALQAIVDEVSDGLTPYSLDSYLPAHLVEQARDALGMGGMSND